MMKSNCRKLLAAVMAVICCMGAFSHPVQNREMTAEAVTIAELEAQKEENNKKIKEYEEKLSQFQADQKQEEAYQNALQNKIDTIQSNMQILDTELEEIKKNLYDLEVGISDMEDRIEKQEQDIDEGLEEFKLRLRAMYVNGNDSLASALVGATDFYDMLSKYELISRVAKHDDDLVNDLKQELADYDQNLRTLEAQQEQEKKTQAEKEAKQQEMKTSMVELQDAYAESAAEQERLAKEEELANASIDDLKEKNRLADEAEKEIYEEIRRAEEAAKKKAEEERKKAEEEAKKKAEEEAKKKAEEEANRQQQSTPSAPDSNSSSGGDTSSGNSSGNSSSGSSTSGNDASSQGSYSDSSFGWPCPGHYYISSTFGSRWGTMHKGIDIAQSKDSDVVASRSGSVIRAVNSCTHNYGKSSNCCGNGYGNHVIIMHDDGTYSTLYGHMSSIVVSVGDYVQKGQTIGYVGSTGYSTGPHLHFEVRKNGTAVDPSGYLNY